MAAHLRQPAGNHKKTDITVNTALPESIPDILNLNFRGENVHSFYAFLEKIATSRICRTSETTYPQPVVTKKLVENTEPKPSYWIFSLPRTT